MNNTNQQHISVIPMFSLLFKLPEQEYGRSDITIVIEYFKLDAEKDEVYCRAWAQVGDAFIRGLVAEYYVPITDNKKELDARVIRALNESEKFRESLAGFMLSAIALDPDAAVQ